MSPGAELPLLRLPTPEVRDRRSRSRRQRCREGNGERSAPVQSRVVPLCLLFDLDPSR